MIQSMYMAWGFRVPVYPKISGTSTALAVLNNLTRNPYAAGLAWLDGHLWNVDFQTRKLYQLAVKDKPMYRLSDTREARVEYLWALNNYGPGEVRELVVNLAVPERLANQELLSEIRFARHYCRKVGEMGLGMIGNNHS